MTGETFDGRRAARIGMVTESVPRARLRERTVEIAKVLMKKNPEVLRQTKTAFKYAAEMPWDAAGEYLMAKSDQTTFNDPERGREKGMGQFLDEKSYKPGLAPYRRDG
jgi:trans-feruloyl-CoA hydratase/vanillin synthase